MIEVKSTPSVATLLVPPVSGGQFAGAVFTKALDTSLWVLRAKLRNSSSDSAHCMGKSVYFCERLLVVAAGGLKIKEDGPILTHPLVCCLPFSLGALLKAVIDLARQ